MPLALHATITRHTLNFYSKDILHLSSNSQSRRERITTVRATSPGDRQLEIFQQALQAATEEDRLEYEEWKARDTGGGFVRLLDAQPYSVRELWLETLKVHKGLQLQPCRKTLEARLVSVLTSTCVRYSWP